MVYTNAQLLGAVLQVDGRATEGGVIELPSGARLLLDVSVDGSGMGETPTDAEVTQLATTPGTGLSTALLATIAAAMGTATSSRSAKLLDLGAIHRQLSSGSARVAYDDASSAIETWGNLTAWSSSTFAQVSGGRLYGLGAAGGSDGANRSFAIAAGEQMRAVFNVRMVNGSGGGGTIVGVSSDAAGGAFSSGGATTRGLYFKANGALATITDGAFGADLATGLPTADYIVTLTADATQLSVVAVNTSTLVEYRAKWARSGFNINNLVVFNSDPRELTGNSVGAVGARKAVTTVTPRTGIEGVSNTVTWTTVNGKGIRVAAPPTYDARVPSPVAYLFHGNGSNETHFADHNNGKAVANALLAAGYIVVSAAHNANVSTWGSDDGITAYNEAYNYVRARFNCGPAVFYCNSMGGIESLNVLARDAVPGVLAWAGSVPTYDLAENRANALFTSTIDTAYGGDYAANSVGHDPNLMNPTLFRGIPMWVLIATDDTSVTPAANGEAMVTDLGAYNPMTRVTTTGGHSTTNIATKAPDIVAFFNAALGR